MGIVWIYIRFYGGEVGNIWGHLGFKDIAPKNAKANGKEHGK